MDCDLPRREEHTRINYESRSTHKHKLSNETDLLSSRVYNETDLLGSRVYIILREHVLVFLDLLQNLVTNTSQYHLRLFGGCDYKRTMTADFQMYDCKVPVAGGGV